MLETAPHYFYDTMLYSSSASQEDCVAYITLSIKFALHNKTASLSPLTESGRGR